MIQLLLGCAAFSNPEIQATWAHTFEYVFMLGGAFVFSAYVLKLLLGWKP